MLDIYNLDPFFCPPMNLFPNIDNPYNDFNAKTNRFVRAKTSFEYEMDKPVTEELEEDNSVLELANSSVPDPSISMSLTPQPEAEKPKSSNADSTKSSASTEKL